MSMLAARFIILAALCTFGCKEQFSNYCPDAPHHNCLNVDDAGNNLCTSDQQCAPNICDLTECLDKLVPLGERHLRVAISEFVEHYHLERNHQGVDNRLLAVVAAPANENVDPVAPIARRECLGGILSYYYRPAA